MATQEQTPFEAWDFSPDEFAIAATFTELQLQYIRTEIAKYAMEKLAAPMEPDNLMKSALHHANLEGSITALELLVSNHEAQKDNAAARLTAQQTSQNEE